MNEISIDNLRLSTRSTNALKRAGILTVEQLIGLNVNDLYKIKNIGGKSVDEICSLIEKINNGEITISEFECQYDTVISEDGKDITYPDLLINIAHNQNNIFVNQIAYVLNNQRVSDIHIKNLLFSNRTYNTLAKNKIFYLSDICKMTIVNGY